MMKKILLIATGGTIASAHSDKEGLTPQLDAGTLLKYVPEVFEICQPTAIQIYNIDSTNVTPEHWRPA